MDTVKQFLRMFALALTLIVISPMALSSKVHAGTQNGIKVSYSVSKAYAAPGSTFSVTLTIQNVSATSYPNLNYISEGYILPGDIQNYKNYTTCVTYNEGANGGCDGLAWQVFNINLPAGGTFTKTEQHTIKANAPLGQYALNPETRIGDSTKASNATPLYRDTGDWSIYIGTSAPPVTQAVTPTPTASASITPSPTPASSVIMTKLPDIFTKAGSRTTDLSKLKSLTDLKNLSNFVLDYPVKNTIEFVEPVDVSDTSKLASLDQYVEMTAVGKVKIDSDAMPGLNKKAKITMSGLQFAQTPTILRDGGDSSNYVTDISYMKETGVLKFSVTGFSTYEAVESRVTATPATLTLKDGGNPLLSAVVLLSLVVIFVVGGGLYWYYKRFRKQHALAFEEHPVSEAIEVNPEVAEDLRDRPLDEIAEEVEQDDKDTTNTQ